MSTCINIECIKAFIIDRLMVTRRSTLLMSSANHQTTKREGERLLNVAPYRLHSLLEAWRGARLERGSNQDSYSVFGS